MTGFNTKAIHEGQEPDEQTGAVTVPLHLATTYAQQGVNQHKGFEYSRTGNPTRVALETSIAALEGATHGFAFGSGMAAEDAIMRMLQPGDNVLLGNDAYGGTFRLLDKIYGKIGVTWTAVDLTKPDLVASMWSDNTKMVWLETPTNPNLTCFDIEAIAAAAHEQGGLCVADNTFATPYLQNPLDQGADIIMHSATKYLSGHSDVIQGALMMNDTEIRDKLYFIQKSCGAVPGPMDCFLVLRGIKTLHVRMERHCENGAKIAHYLRQHPKVLKVYWCGFEDHPGYTVAKKQMRDFGGMLSFTLKDESIEAANKVLSSTHLFSLAESLGGVESLINHPASMTHASIPREERIKNGLSESLIRLSVGIEDADDLIEDLNKAIG